MKIDSKSTVVPIAKIFRGKLEIVNAHIVTSFYVKFKEGEGVELFFHQT